LCRWGAQKCGKCYLGAEKNEEISSQKVVALVFLTNMNSIHDGDALKDQLSFCFCKLSVMNSYFVGFQRGKIDLNSNNNSKKFSKKVFLCETNAADFVQTFKDFSRFFSPLGKASICA